jgi:hypothetical protein
LRRGESGRGRRRERKKERKKERRGKRKRMKEGEKERKNERKKERQRARGKTISRNHKDLTNEDRCPKATFRHIFVFLFFLFSSFKLCTTARKSCSNRTSHS